FATHVWQIPSTLFRATLAGCRVIVYEHLNGTFSVGYGPHSVARFAASGEPLDVPRPKRRRTDSRPVSRTVSASTTPASPFGLRRGSVPADTVRETKKQDKEPKTRKNSDSDANE